MKKIYTQVCRVNYLSVKNYDGLKKRYKEEQQEGEASPATRPS